MSPNDSKININQNTNVDLDKIYQKENTNESNKLLKLNTRPCIKKPIKEFQINFK